MKVKLQFAQNIKKLLHQYFRSEENFDISLLKINNEEDLHIILS